jgi:hypothetical protein
MDQHEGDVSEYLRQQRAAAATYNNNNGSISGGAGIQIGNVQATQQVNVGLDPAALREVVDMLRPQLGQFGDAEPEARAGCPAASRFLTAHQFNAGSACWHASYEQPTMPNCGLRSQGTAGVPGPSAPTGPASAPFRAREPDALRQRVEPCWRDQIH